MNSLRCLFKTKKTLTFTIFDLIYQLILNNKTFQPIIHKNSKSPKMNVKGVVRLKNNFFKNALIIFSF